MFDINTIYDDDERRDHVDCPQQTKLSHARPRHQTQHIDHSLSLCSLTLFLSLIETGGFSARPRHIISRIPAPLLRVAGSPSARLCTATTARPQAAVCVLVQGRRCPLGYPLLDQAAEGCTTTRNWHHHYRNMQFSITSAVTSQQGHQQLEEAPRDSRGS